LDNTSPYLAAQGGVSNPEGPFIFLEENAFGPNTLPLWQLVSIKPLSYHSPCRPNQEVGILNGSYFYQCLDPECRTWTDDVIRNVGVDGMFTAAPGSRPPCRRWPPRPDLGEHWPSRLVATAAEHRLSFRTTRRSRPPRLPNNPAAGRRGNRESTKSLGGK
jgi:hypothetical protein